MLRFLSNSFLLGGLLGAVAGYPALVDEATQFIATNQLMDPEDAYESPFLQAQHSSPSLELHLTSTGGRKTRLKLGLTFWRFALLYFYVTVQLQPFCIYYGRRMGIAP